MLVSTTISKIVQVFTYPFYGYFKIKKGKHYSSAVWTPRIVRRCVRDEVKWLKFDANIINARYGLGNDNDQINKLFGYSLSLFESHHKNSIRIGWTFNPTTDKVDFYAYYYDGGLRFVEYLGNQEVDKYDNCSVSVEMCTTSGQHIVMFNDEVFAFNLLSKPSGKFGWILNPYFGGTQAAPHELGFIIRQKS